MNVLSKVRDSSTFWVAILLPALNVVSTLCGYPIPWDVVAVAVGGEHVPAGVEHHDGERLESGLLAVGASGGDDATGLVEGEAHECDPFTLRRWWWSRGSV